MTPAIRELRALSEQPLPIMLKTTALSHCQARKIADPMVDFFRVGYETGAVGYFVPTPRSFDLEVRGTEGRALAWDNGMDTRIQRPLRRGDEVEETTIHAAGDPPGITNIRNIIREIETGERTDGNINVTMQAVETQFGIAYFLVAGRRAGVAAGCRPEPLHSRWVRQTGSPLTIRQGQGEWFVTEAESLLRI